MQPDLAGKMPANCRPFSLAICGGIVWQSAPVKEIYRFLFAHFVQPDLAGKMPANCRPIAGHLQGNCRPNGNLSFFLIYSFFLWYLSEQSKAPKGPLIANQAFAKAPKGPLQMHVCAGGP